MYRLHAYREVIDDAHRSSVVPTVLVRKNSNTRKYIITGSLLLLCFIAGIWFNQYISKGDASLVVNTKYQNNNKDNNKADKNALPSNKDYTNK